MGACYRGVIEQNVMGQPVRTNAVLCCPGDWPEILEQIPESERPSWSTVRLGTWLFALGLPSGPAISRFEHFIHRDGLSDRMLTNDSRVA